MTVLYGKIYLICRRSNIYTLRDVVYRNILGFYFGGSGKERDDDLNYWETLKPITEEIFKFMEVERALAFREDTDS